MRRSFDRAFATALTVALLVCATRAQADLGPPPSCPLGTEALYNRGHFCGAVDCLSDADCKGMQCTERPVCLSNHDSAFEYLGECGAKKCGMGDCVTKKICTVGPFLAKGGGGGSGDLEGPKPKRACGCAVPGAAFGDEACVLALAAGACALLLRRRRR